MHIAPLKKKQKQKSIRVLFWEEYRLHVFPTDLINCHHYYRIPLDEVDKK